MRSLKRMLHLAVLALVAGALTLGSALPAAAHGGAIDLRVVPDGVGGISFSATYEGDGDTVEDIMDPVLTATSRSGDKVGPISLISASEGQGVWITPQPVLAPGHWNVTVVTTKPEAAHTSVEIDVVSIATPAKTTAGTPAAAAAPIVTAGPTSATGWIVAAVAVIVAFLIILLVVRLSKQRRRGTATAR